jgi:transcriptional regulator with XRE-family HTH domain
MTGIEIRDARLKKGLTQRELSLKMSVPEATISRWENDFQKPMKIYMEKLIEILK